MTAGLEPREVLACVIAAVLAMWASYQLGRAAGVRIGERRGFSDGVERMRSSDFGDVDPLEKFRGSLVTPREFVRMRSGRVVTSPTGFSVPSAPASPQYEPGKVELLPAAAFELARELNLEHRGDAHAW